MLERCQEVTPEVASLLALAMWPDPARIAATLERYAHEPELQIWTWSEAGRPVCAAGVRVSGRAAELLHLGTHPQDRGRGYARRLVSGLLEGLRLDRLEAETDDEAVGFYRRCGFAIGPQEARGGRARYRCTLTTGGPS